MKHLAITVVLCAITSVARAEGDRSSLFSCGIQFGGNQFTFSPPAETKSREAYRAVNPRLRFVAGADRAESLHFSPSEPADFGATEKRLPPKFTFATVGCSWH